MKDNPLEIYNSGLWKESCGYHCVMHEIYLCSCSTCTFQQIWLCYICLYCEPLSIEKYPILPSHHRYIVCIVKYVYCSKNSHFHAYKYVRKVRFNKRIVLSGTCTLPYVHILSVINLNICKNI